MLDRKSSTLIYLFKPHRFSPIFNLAKSFPMRTAMIFLFLFIANISFAQETNLSNSLLFDGEPYIAQNPANPRNLVVAWMGLKFNNGGFHIAIKTRASFDGGNTWSAVQTLPHLSPSFGSADVSMAFDLNGLLYLSYIDYRQLPDSGGVYVARSHNGGLTFDAPSKAFDMYDVAGKRPVDRPFIAVDANNGAKVFITTKPAPWIAPPNRAYYKVSSDSGRTWTAIQPIDQTPYLIGNAIAAPLAALNIAADGSLQVLYPSYVPSQNPLPTFYRAASNNFGASWNYNLAIALNPGAADTNYKNAYHLICHPTDANKMCFVTTGYTYNDADIFSLHSEDGGNTWSAIQRVNDDAQSNGKGQDMVWSAYNERGDIAICWRDRRNASNNGFWNADYQFYYTTSTDNGASFSTNKMINTSLIPFDSLIVENGNDVMCCAFHADTLYTVWGDTRNGKMNIYFNKILSSSNASIGFADLDNSLDWTIFPNPSHDIVKIKGAPAIVGKQWTLLNAEGQCLARGLVSQAEFEISLTEVQARGFLYLTIGEEGQVLIAP